MKQTAVQQKLINLAVQKAGNDSEAARQLGWLAKRFNHYRLGSRCADDDAIVDLARMVGEDPKKAVIQHRAEQAKTAEMRQFWLSFSKAAAVVLVVGATLLPVVADANLNDLQTRNYAKLRNWLKRAMRKIFGGNSNVNVKSTSSALLA